MCSGRVETLAVVEALQGRADGVLVVGCRFGECHYEGGNYQFDSRIEVVGRLLSHLGIDRGRIAFRQCSSAEGNAAWSGGCTWKVRIAACSPAAG